MRILKSGTNIRSSVPRPPAGRGPYTRQQVMAQALHNKAMAIKAHYAMQGKYLTNDQIMKLVREIAEHRDKRSIR